MALPLSIKKTYGHVAVVSDHVLRDRWGHVNVTCQCDCGRVFSVRRSDLARGYTKSCGCRMGFANKQFEGRY